MRLRTLGLDQIKASSLNPRQVFDPDALAQLAESIEKHGLLQPLLVRPHRGSASTPAQNGNGQATYELVAGERRWRAIARLRAEGRSAPETIPVQVADLSDIEALLAAIAENADRDDLSELEEAEGYLQVQKLAKRGQGATAKIAKVCGRTQRYVQKRIALAKKLCPTAKDELRKGLIDLEMATALTRYPQDLQEAFLEKHSHRDAWALDNFATEGLPSSRDAEFDTNLYQNAVRKGRGGNVYFLDLIEFERMQSIAFDKKIVSLRRKYEWVDVLDEPFDQWSRAWRYEYTYGTPPKSCGAVIFRDGFKIVVCENLLHKEAKKRDRVDPMALTKSHTEKFQRIWTEAARESIVKTPLAALRLACQSLLQWGSTSSPMAASGSFSGAFAAILEPMGFTMWQKTEDSWAIISKMDFDELNRLLAVLVANRFLLSAEDMSFIESISAMLDLPNIPVSLVGEEYLKSYRKPRLIAMAKEIDPDLDTSKMKVKELKAFILDHPDYCPPELRFASLGRKSERRSPTEARPGG